MSQNQPDGSPVYRQLDTSFQEVRLLQVSQILSNGLICCHLKHTALRETKFVVLSYRWGHENASYEILLDGQVFQVRRNLFEFLNVIRRQTDMLLWIDALCINQADAIERSQQVQIMGDIFRSASMVLSWLGPMEQSTMAIGKAFELMDAVWNSAAPLPIAQESSTSLPQYEKLPLESMTESQDDLWHCVASLCSLTYWNRVWVVQEVMLSSNNYLLYGEKPLPWQVFANFLSLIDVRFRCPPAYTRAIHNSTAKSYAMTKPYKSLPRNLQWQMGNQLTYDFGRIWDTEEHNLFRILTMFGDRDCTDPLDHVYALLSLTSEGQSLSVRYGIAADQLFVNVIHFCAVMSVRGRPTPDLNQVYRPSQQRAFFRNTRYLAEIMGLVTGLVKTQPYFQGANAILNSRTPNPKPDPGFMCEDQILALDCSRVQEGNEPPALRSNSLQRKLARFSFNVLLHIEESTSWLLCRVEDTHTPEIVAFVTIKDSPQGRGFKIIEPGPLSVCELHAWNSGMNWTIMVPPAAHFHLLKALILQEQPAA